MSVTVTKVAGLFTSPNELQSVPNGALVKADNCVIRTSNVIESRRGQEILSYTFGAGSDRANEIFFYNGTPLVQYGTTLARDTGSAFTAYSGTFTPPDSALLRMKGVEAMQSFYFTSTAGVQTLDSVSGTPGSAGVPQALDPYVSSYSSGLGGGTNDTGTWLPAGSKVAYRTVIGIKNANNVVKLGPPSGRLVITNPEDLEVPVGDWDLVGNVVTVTYNNHGFIDGDKFDVDGEPLDVADHADNTVLTGATVASFTYARASADYSNTAVVTITSGTKYTSFRAYLPSGLTTSHFIRVYRSDYTDGAASTDSPSDEMYQVYEAFLTAGEIAQGYVAITDKTPVEMMGDPLYTNPATGEGLVNSNYEPPVAKDIAEWNGRMWAANTTIRHYQDIQLLGVGSPDGIQNNDTITIAGRTYTGVTGTPAAMQFKITTVYDSAALNVYVTAKALVQAINLDTSNTSVYAYYMSGDGDVPGKIRLEARSLSGSTFYVSASRPASWAPVPPTTYSITEASSSRSGTTVTVTTGSAHGFSVGQVVELTSNSAVAAFPVGNKTIASTPSGTTFTYTEGGATPATMSGTYQVAAITTASNNDAAPNRLFYSKYQQMESFPRLNYIDIGSKNKVILRVVPLRDKLYVFKEDGIFTVTGDAPFRVDMLDDTAKLLAPDSVVTVGNQIYALTYQGVVAVSEGGAAIVSRPIESELMATALLYQDTSSLYSFGVAYESDRSYILFLASSETHATEAYVYNYLSNAWTRWTTARRCARLSPSTDKLYLGHASSNSVWRERKEFLSTDYRDETTSVTVSTVTTNADGSHTLAFSAALTGLATGDTIRGIDFFGPAFMAVVTDPGDAQTTVTVHSDNTPFTGTATWSKAISCEVAWAAQTAGAPAQLKHFRECQIHFRKHHFYAADAKFSTDLATSEVSVPLVFSDRASVVGVDQRTRVLPANKRVYVPKEHQRASAIQVGFVCSEAYAMWQLNGYTLEVEQGSERGNK